jgi:two-component system, NtrC family, sensor kinase
LGTLVYNPGQPDEKVFAIGEAAVTIGRAEDQAICIPHKSLSRSHARIEPDEGRFVVVDLGSKNGTLVNGVRVQRREVGHGDTITLGDLDLLFRTDPPSIPDPSDHGLRPMATRALLRSPLVKLGSMHGAAGSRDEAGRAGRQLRILIEVAMLLPVSDDVDALLQRILDLCFQILDVDRGALLLVDDRTGLPEPRVVKTAQGVRGDQPIYSQNIVDYVLRHSAAAIFTDAASDPRLGAAESVVAQSIRASMCVPLKPRDAVIGVLYVDNLRALYPFTEDDLELFAAFAGQAAVAIENARLHRRLAHEMVERTQLVMEGKLASLGALVAGIAHELRNPLNFMTNFAELSAGLAAELAEGLAAHGARLPEDARAEMQGLLEDLEANTSRIGEHGRRANAVIQGMLEHGRRSSPGGREPASLNAVVAEGVQLAREGPLGRAFDVRVVEAYDPALPPMEMAALDMGRVFLNVAENALYAMREKKRVQGDGYVPELVVRTAVRGDMVEARIRDNGAGIPAAVVEKVFEPFFTTKPAGQGTGLGLSLSREIVVQGHQGTMRVESEEGEGTEIVVALPRGR